MAMLAKTGPTVTTNIKNKEWEKFDRNDPKRAGWKLKKLTPG